MRAGAVGAALLALAATEAAPILAQGPWRLVERSARHRPAWVTERPEAPGLFFATGVATGAPTLEAGIERAVQDAVAETARFVGQEALVCYVQSEEAWATKVRSLLRLRAASQISGGRWVELYYERWRRRRGPPAADRYDVYVLYAVPLEEVERERLAWNAWLRTVEERARGVLETLERASPFELESFDLVPALAALEALERLDPGNPILTEARARLGELLQPVRLELTLQPGEALPGWSVGVRALAGRRAPRPIAGLPLEITLWSGAGLVRRTARTGPQGTLQVPVEPPLELPEQGGRLTVAARAFLDAGAIGDPSTEEAQKICGGATLREALSRAVASAAELRVFDLVAPGGSRGRPAREAGADLRLDVLPGPITLAEDGARFRAAYLFQIRAEDAAAGDGRPQPVPRRIVLGLDAGLARQARWGDAVAEGLWRLFQLVRPDETVEVLSNDPALPVVHEGGSALHARLAQVRWQHLRAGNSHLDTIEQLAQRLQQAVEDARHRGPGEVVSVLLLQSDRLPGASSLACAGSTAIVAAGDGFAGQGQDPDGPLLRGVEDGRCAGGIVLLARDPHALVRSVEAVAAAGRANLPATLVLQLERGAQLVRFDGAGLRLGEEGIQLRAGSVVPGGSREVYVEFGGTCGQEAWKRIGEVVLVSEGSGEPVASFGLSVPCHPSGGEAQRSASRADGDARVRAYGALLEALSALSGPGPGPLARSRQVRAWWAAWAERIAQARATIPSDMAPSHALADLELAAREQLERLRRWIEFPLGERWWAADPDYFEGLSRRLFLLRDRPRAPEPSTLPAPWPPGPPAPR